MVDRATDAPKIEAAIRHAKDVAKDNEGTDCEQEHLQLAEWLKELLFQRENVARLMREVDELRKEQLRLRRTSSISPDSNIHMRLTISQDHKSWMVAHRISSNISTFCVNMPGLMLEVGTKLLHEAIEGFLAEKNRRGL